LQKALDVVRELQERYKHIGVQDAGAVFNTDILEAWELGCLLDLAEVTALSALNRTESRGAHWREDFPKRDDVNWLKHTFVTLQDGKQVITYKPVTLTKFEPKERKY
jgi:succinate dehydrogenase flavoprotein subunit